ncbi:hypothetical protein [Ruminococcus sp. OA3]|nr:hypothetical protein [Ruminococcus sp. OA3]
MSVWENKESVTKGRNLSEHRMAQQRGRTHDFEDSNSYLEV